MMDLFWTYFHHIFAAVCAFLCTLGLISLPASIVIKISECLEKRKKKVEKAENNRNGRQSNLSPKLYWRK